MSYINGATRYWRLQISTTTVGHCIR